MKWLSPTFWMSQRVVEVVEIEIDEIDGVDGSVGRIRAGLDSCEH